jgi:hypothetical protein
MGSLSVAQAVIGAGVCYVGVGSIVDLKQAAVDRAIVVLVPGAAVAPGFGEDDGECIT